MYNIAAVFIGGGLGSISRYGISEFVKVYFKTSFPLGTLLSNIISCAVLALSVLLLNEKVVLHSTLRSLIIIGFCGGFSTFSSFSFETVELFKTGNYLVAVTNIFLSVFICVVLVYFILKKQ